MNQVESKSVQDIDRRNLLPDSRCIVILPGRPPGKVSLRILVSSFPLVENVFRDRGARRQEFGV
jgi:hypothetical protein